MGSCPGFIVAGPIVSRQEGGAHRVFRDLDVLYRRPGEARNRHALTVPRLGSWATSGNLNALDAICGSCYDING